jgi:hypothetical protein
VPVCLLVFTGIVVYLQEIQEHYDWERQFMSELALGRQGGLMCLAFMFLALALVFHAGTVKRMRFAPASWSRVPGWLAHGAAAAFIGAGLVNLQDDAALHIACVLLAFILMLLSLFFILRESVCRALRVGAVLSILTVACALLLAKLQILEPGQTQRLCALGFLGWLVYAEIWTGVRHGLGWSR